MNEDDVVLIRKTKPEWQAGKLNFVGGKVEDDETPLDCMVREFREETSVDIPADDWKYVGQMSRPDVFEISMFAHTSNAINGVITTTEEQILTIGHDKFMIDSGLRKELISNITTIYEFVQSQDFKDGAILEIKYSQ